MAKISYIEQYIIDKTTPREYFGKKQSTYGEMISKYTFEWIFNKSFPTQYPEFIGNMELDGLNAELKIAFEHQGPWHNMNFCQWKYQTGLKDDYKLEMCKENDILLVQIPCINKGQNNIKRGVEFILKNLDDKNIATRFDYMLPSEFLNEKNEFIQKLGKISFKKETNCEDFIKPNIETIWEENDEMKYEIFVGEKSYYQWVLKNLDKLMFYARIWLEKYYKKNLIDLTQQQINEEVLMYVYFWKTSRDFKKSNTGGFNDWFKYPKINLNKEQKIAIAWQFVYQQK